MMLYGKTHTLSHSSSWEYSCTNKHLREFLVTLQPFPETADFDILLQGFALKAFYLPTKELKLLK